ncbi:hypothetical protein GOODEAATRI_010803 [Goodea atripinnis]|uniref:Uncharacterized protein n=1 Tax=Goodea atripinnis TaxID=208336 RepID=A0ABV0PN41_9TELE
MRITATGQNSTDGCIGRATALALARYGARVTAVTRTQADLDSLVQEIRVNSVNPTAVMTEMGQLGWSDPEKARTMTSRIPLGRFAGQIL